MTWLASVRLAAMAAGLVGTLLLPAAGPAGAADPAPDPSGPLVVAALHTVAPSALTGDDDSLVLSGTVQNTGDEAVQNAQVLPRFSRMSIQSRADIGRVGTDETLLWGARYGDVYDPIDDSLEPGETQPFSITVPTELLDFGAAGVYVVGVDVMGSPAGSEDRLRLHTARTVVPWLPDGGGPLPRVPVSMLWPVAARPTMLPDATLIDDSLAAQIGAGQPLTELVNAAVDAPVTWAVDPDLIDTAAVMAQGYEVMSASGPIEGSQADSDAARDWLSALRQSASGHQVLNLPYAVPDIEAVAATDAELADTVMNRSVAVSTSDALRPGSLATAAAPVGWLDKSSVTGRALGALAVTGVNTVIVPGDAVSRRTEQAAATFTLGEADLDAVVTDAGLDDAISDAAAATDVQAGALDVRQRWFAETALIAMSAAANDVAPAPMAAAPPLRWRPESGTARAVVAAWTSIPWVEPVALDDAGAASPAAEPVEPRPDDSANLLPAANVDAAADVLERSGQYASLLADPDDAPDGLPLAPVRATSSGWRDDPAAGEAYAESINADLTSHLGEVSVTVPESVTLSSRNGTFPLTVTNDLPQAISVGLDIDSANVDRLRIEDVEVQQIEAGARELVHVTAQAAANGKVPINVQLTTADGVRIGPRRPTVVNATDYGTIGWVIVAGAGALFAVALVRRAVRSRRNPDDSDSDDHDSDSDSGHGADAPATDPVQEATR